MPGCPGRPPAQQLLNLHERRNFRKSLNIRIDCHAVEPENAVRLGPGACLVVGALDRHYDMLEVLGRGSRGLVRRAIRRRDNVEMALKITDAADVEMQALARAEFEVLQRCHHPNIIRALDYFTTRHEAVLALEFVRGSTLKEAVRYEPLAEVVAHGLFALLLSSVAYLHERRVVHRDIKPENVMVSTDLTDVRLIDFNVARQLVEGRALSPTGTKLYAPPEFHRGEPPSEASDVWAVGLCLFVMLTSRLPEIRKDASRPVTQHTSFSQVSLTTVNASGPCKALLDLCLADRMMRPAASIAMLDPWVRLGPTGIGDRIGIELLRGNDLLLALGQAPLLVGRAASKPETLACLPRISSPSGSSHSDSDDDSGLVSSPSSPTSPLSPVSPGTERQRHRDRRRQQLRPKVSVSRFMTTPGGMLMSASSASASVRIAEESISPSSPSSQSASGSPTISPTPSPPFSPSPASLGYKARGPSPYGGGVVIETRFGT